MRPLVSVIVPVYNVEYYLDQCIQSILNQTLTNIEILLIDDQSTDQSPHICDKYAFSYPQIKVIHKIKNEGLGMACNTGIENATGKYIAFCDSDDYIDSHMYQTLYNAAQEYNCNVVFSAIKRVNTNGQVLNTLPHYKEFKLLRQKSEIHSLLKDMIASAPNIKEERPIQVSAKTVFYDRNLIEKKHIRFVSERLLPSEDLIFNIDILANSNKVCILPQAFYNYRINQLSISQTINKNKFILFKNLYSHILNQCFNYNIEGDYPLRVQRMLIGYTRSYISKIISSTITSKEKKYIYSSICKDRIWEQIWKTYPLKKESLYHGIFSYAIRHNNYLMPYYLVKIRNIKNNL